MADIENLGKILIVMGIVIALVGVAVTFGSRLTGIGRLPGDILLTRDGVVFYIPILSCLILSIVLTIVANLVARLIR